MKTGPIHWRRSFLDLLRAGLVYGRKILFQTLRSRKQGKREQLDKTNYGAAQ